VPGQIRRHVASSHARHSGVCICLSLTPHINVAYRANPTRPLKNHFSAEQLLMEEGSQVDAMPRNRFLRGCSRNRYEVKMRRQKMFLR
jgi:hypothetical protein